VPVRELCAADASAAAGGVHGFLVIDYPVPEGDSFGFNV
jgi:hypothetical protein